MTAIRCPKCKLINKEDVRRCRRCGTPISSKNEGKALESKTLNVSPSARRWAVPAIVIVSGLCIYGFYKYSQDAPKSTAGIPSTNKSVVQSAPENRDIETVKKLHQDFMAQLDQNIADRGGESLKKNQALASKTMTLLNQQENNLNDPVAKTYLSELSRLVGKYNAQLNKYGSETLNRSEANARVDIEAANLQNDPSKNRPRTKYIDIAPANSLSSRDIDETVSSLRNLSASVADK